ncbi:Hypothetical protein NGAL_HAMBI1146_22680 [Neorhizobium galegae bv. officinalis]|nr:Hypothetical protein NGAL_HAMBI1146_22680 [Neorhizobium galegae bv. officinalis]
MTASSPDKPIVVPGRGMTETFRDLRKFDPLKDVE